jgi:threonine/homoserine/homoserine lactone efflux protein
MVWRSLVAGWLCGFVVSLPVGPMNLTVINRALRRGFWSAFLAGLGAISAEVIYAALMLAGHSTILDMPEVVWGMRFAALIIITALGLRYVLIRPEKIQATDQQRVEKISERWHHPRSFLLGFVLTISNFMLLVLWATLATLLFAHEWVVPRWPSRTVCVVGVFFGGLTWFFLLAFSVSRARGRLKPDTLTELVRGSGAVFLLLAALLAYKLF